MRLFLALVLLLGLAPGAFGEEFPPGKAFSDGTYLVKNPEALQDSFSRTPGSFPIAAEWGEEQTLSDSSLLCFHPKLAAGGSYLHILTYVPFVPYHFRSSDWGASWSLWAVYHDTVPNNDAGIVNVCAGQNRLYTTWWRPRDSWNAKVYFRASTDNGATWPVDKEITQTPLISPGASYGNVAGRGPTVFVSFKEDSIGCWRSLDGGRTWSNPGYVAGKRGVSYPPSIFYNGGVVGIAYYEWMDRELDVRFVRSIDNGQSFEPPQRLGIPDGYYGQWPEVAGDSLGNVAVVWMDYRESPHTWMGAAYCRISHDGGESWDEVDRLDTRNFLVNPDMGVVVEGDFIAVAWSEESGILFGQIHYRESWDGGETWLPEQVPAYGWVDSPRLLKRGDTMHLTFVETMIVAEPDTEGKFVKYLKNEGLTGIWEEEGEESPLPGESGLLRVYPNPFNSSTTFILSGRDELEIGIYDITGRRVATLMVHDGRAMWEAGGYSSGVYFARVMGEKDGGALRLVVLR